MKKTTKFDVAEQIRSLILAYLNQNRGVPMRAVMAHLVANGVQICDSRTSDYLTDMEKLGEVERVKLGAVSPVNGRRVAAWYPLTDKTTTADELKSHIGANLKGRKESKSLADARQEAKENSISRVGANGGRVYLCGDNPEIHKFRAEGQSSGVMKRGVQSSASATLCTVRL